MYLIVPAVTDQAGRCNIVFQNGFEGDALKDYRANPDSWKTVGHINSRGELVALDAPVGIYQALKGFEPLMAGICIPKHDLEVDAFTADLGYFHPAKSLLMDLPAGTPFTMLHRDSGGASHLTYCTTTGAKPVKMGDGDYQIDILMHQPDGVTAAPLKLDVSSDGRCHLLVDGEYYLDARPLVVGFATALTKDEVRDEAGTTLNQKFGRIWRVANDELELMTEVDRLSRAGAHLCTLERESESVIHYSFVLNKEHAKAILGYTPDAEEWLEHDEHGILPYLMMSMEMDVLAEANKTTPAPARENRP